jgi:hypothetical protein
VQDWWACNLSWPRRLTRDDLRRNGLLWARTVTSVTSSAGLRRDRDIWEILYRNRVLLQVAPDATYVGMWRIRHPAGRLSDIVNLSREKDSETSLAFGILNADKRRLAPLLMSWNESIATLVPPGQSVSRSRPRERDQQHPCRPQVSAWAISGSWWAHTEAEGDSPGWFEFVPALRCATRSLGDDRAQGRPFFAGDLNQSIIGTISPANEPRKRHHI